MCGYDDIVYSIHHEDLQTYANKELRRELTSDELKRVGDKIGDFIDWYGAVGSAVQSLNIEGKLKCEEI